MAAGFLLLGGTTTLPGAAVALAFLGATVGASTPVLGAFWAEFYGSRHIGAIRAMAVAVMVLGSAVGPALTGSLIDRGITFPDQTAGIAIYFLLASGLAAMAMRRARPMLSLSG